MPLRVRLISPLVLCLLVLLARSNGDAAAANIVDSINAQAFADAKNLYDGAHGQIVISAVARAQVRLIVRVGAAAPPTYNEVLPFSVLARAIADTPGTRFESRIWADDIWTEYDPSLQRLEEAMGVDTVSSHWMLDQSDVAPVDKLMVDWLVDRGIGTVPDPKPAERVVKSMNAAAFFQRPSSHPFNTLTYLSRSATFAAMRPMAHGLVTMPIYRGDAVRGFRLDSADGATEVYVFRGPSSAIVDLQSNLTIARWKSIVAGFTNSVTPMPHLDLSVEEDFGFEPLVEHAFGTWFNKPFERSAVERVRLSLTMKQLSFKTIAGVEGVAGDNLFLRVESGGFYPFARFSNEEPQFCIVRDTHTGAILAIASSYKGQH